MFLTTHTQPLDGCVALSYKIEFQIKGERETRIRRCNLGTTAKEVAMVWACAAKGRQRLVKK